MDERDPKPESDLDPTPARKPTPLPDEIPIGETLMGRFLDEGDDDWGEQGDFKESKGWDKRDPWALDLDDPEHEEVDEDDRGDENLGASDLAHDEDDEDHEDDPEHESQDPHVDEDDEDDEWD